MQRLLMIFLLFGHIFFFNPTLSFAKVKEKKEKDAAAPGCTKVGEVYCPGGFQPDCPEQYKPACVFVGTMHLPGCLADSPDTTAFNYRLDKISCKKGK